MPVPVFSPLVDGPTGSGGSPYAAATWNTRYSPLYDQITAHLTNTPVGSWTPQNHQTNAIVPTGNLSMVTTRQLQPGTQHLANDMFARMWNEIVDADQTPANFVTKTVPITLSAINGYLNGTNPVAARLTRSDNGKVISQVPGDKLWYVVAGTANQFDSLTAEWAIGTSASPFTAGGPIVKISVTHNQAANVYGVGTGPGITEGSVALSLYSYGKSTQGVQNGALYALSKTDATATGADTVAISGVGIANSGSTRTGFGAYFQGQRNGSTGYAVGMEVRGQNEGGVHSPYTTPASWGGADTYGINLGAGSVGGFRAGPGLSFISAGTSWTAGVIFAAGSVSLASIDDASSSTYGWRDAGTHSYGLYLNGTYASGALRFANTQGIVFRNAANSADRNMIQSDASDRVLIYGIIQIDVAGNITTPGRPRFGTGAKLITLADGSLDGAQMALGTIPKGAMSPGYVTAHNTGVDLTIDIPTIDHWSSNGVLTSFSVTNSNVLAAQVSGSVARNTLLYLDDSAALQALSVTQPATPQLPDLGTALAIVALPINATSITQASITDRRRMFTGRNASSVGGGGGGLAAGSFTSTNALTKWQDSNHITDSAISEVGGGGGVSGVVTITGTLQTTGTVGFGSTPATDRLVAIGGTSASVGLNSYGIIHSPSITIPGSGFGFGFRMLPNAIFTNSTAPAQFSGVYLNGMTASGSPSGVTLTALNAIEVPSWPAISGVTITDARVLMLNAPTAATNNAVIVASGGSSGFGTLTNNRPTATLHAGQVAVGTTTFKAVGITGATVNLWELDASLSAGSQKVVGDLHGHIAISQSAAPASSGLGTNVTSVTCVGSDQSGVVTVVMSGAATANATLGTITFSTAFATAPAAVSLVPVDTATWGLAGAAQLTGQAATTTTWLVKAGSTGAGAGTYKYSYDIL